MNPEDTRIRQAADEPAKPAPRVEWWDAADVYFMESLNEAADDARDGILLQCDPAPSP